MSAVAMSEAPEVLAASELTHINSLADFIDQPPASLLAGLRRLWDRAITCEEQRRDDDIGRNLRARRLLTWNVCRRYFAFLLEGSGRDEAAALCFLRPNLVKQWKMEGDARLDLCMEDEDRFPITVQAVFAIGVALWEHRRRKNFRDQVMAEAKKDPRYLVWAITLLEREEADHYGRKSVIKAEIEQSVTVTHKMANGLDWSQAAQRGATRNVEAAPVRETHFLPEGDASPLRSQE